MARATARVFQNGRSQAVRLPAEFRFDTDEVFVRRDEMTGDIVLSPKPASLTKFFELLDGTEAQGFLEPSARQQGAGDRDPFDGWID